MRRIPYVLVDVFTNTPLAGNQLAVFTHAQALTEEDLQALARETNLSETTFVLKGTSDAVPVRIFTVQEELPFAGHPTLGTAAVVRDGRSEVTLDLKVGRIPVRFEQRADGLYGEMTQRDPVFGRTHPRASAASALGLPLQDLSENLPIQTVSTGLEICVVPLASLAALQRLDVNWSSARRWLEQSDARFFYFVSRETLHDDARLQARMIFYNGEDPATGSAAGCTAAWMVAHGVSAPGERVLIEQGLELKRPSRIFVSAERGAQGVHQVRVGGHVVEVARGEFLLP